MRMALGGLLLMVRAICRGGTLVAFAVLIGVVLLQVAGRLPGMPGPAWTEEVARFALVYLVGFSCGLAVLRGELINVDMFVGLLPPSAQRIMERVVDLVMIGFCVAILPGAWDYVAFSAGERARSLDLPMIWIYAVMLLIPGNIAFFSLMRLFGFGARKAPPGHGEVT